MKPLLCPLCTDGNAKQPVTGQDDRRYFLCQRCRLIFAHAEHLLAPPEERARYETHENSIYNRGYVRYLGRLLDPLLPHLDHGMRGLDFGCGPGPTLSEMIRQHGMTCEAYDPFFFPRPPSPPYDFIVSTECFEHFHRPRETIESIVALLAPGGVLGVMTKWWINEDAFAQWQYTQDDTHVAFFHGDTFRYLCLAYPLSMMYDDGDRVVLLQRDRGAAVA